MVTPVVRIAELRDSDLANRWALVVAGAIFTICAMLVPARQADAEPDGNAALAALEAQRAGAIRAKNLKDLMAIYAPDVFAFDFSPPRQWVGAAAYRETYEVLFKEPGPIAFEAEDLRITVLGDVGYSHQIQHFKGTYNSKPIEAYARCTDVYRKIGGKWLIVQEHISVPVDLDTGKFDLMSKP